MAPSTEFPDRSIRLRQFFGCLATVVEYLYQYKIRHKDIKPQNILVKGDQVLLTDFGTSRCWVDEPVDTTIGTNQQAFTVAYCAPEVANHEVGTCEANHFKTNRSNRRVTFLPIFGHWVACSWKCAPYFPTKQSQTCVASFRAKAPKAGIFVIIQKELSYG